MQTMNAKEAYAEAWMYYLTGNFTTKQISEVLDIPMTTLIKHMHRNKWRERRQGIHEKAGNGLKKKLAERIEQARIQHMEMTLDGLDETAAEIAERKIGELDPDDPKGERKVTLTHKMDLIDHQHRIATSVLKLDDIEKTDPNRVGFEFLIALQGNTHMTISDANPGILRSNNAQLEDHVTPEIEAESEILEVVDGVARKVKHEDLVEMLRANGYDAHDISHCDELPPTPKDIPVKLTFK